MDENRIHLGFVLLSESGFPDGTALRSAAQQLALGDVELGVPDDVTVSHVIGGTTVVIGLMPSPHPDAPTMPVGPYSPQIEAPGPPAHLIVTFLNLKGSALERDARAVRTLSAVTLASPAVAAMHGHGKMFFRADAFTSFVANAGAAPPTEVLVDITFGDEGNGRVSFLTHGLVRYGREEFYVTAPADNAANGFAMADSMARWMLLEPDKVLPTGDTVGSNAQERVRVQRGPSPIADHPDVIRLDL